MKTIDAIDTALDALCRDLPDLMRPIDPTGQRRVFECFAEELRAACAQQHRPHLEGRLAHVWTHCQQPGAEATSHANTHDRAISSISSRPHAAGPAEINGQ